ncbi:hypothetical protein BpHYR1_001744 [Brachionus plicatilis]|uniref:Uncharacterized protein n=1 Tax=Brachionus plicatilis TaxID=10195 RepID=A0A3M7RC18_BRAPC|nr:hypothetical protein BpHYR1_001744 [Brachionus plicatilis]
MLQKRFLNLPKLFFDFSINRYLFFFNFLIHVLLITHFDATTPHSKKEERRGPIFNRWGLI